MLFQGLCALWLYASVALAQYDFNPSNTTALEPKSDHPYFNVTATDEPKFPQFQIVPLGAYANMGRRSFEASSLQSRLVLVTPDNMDNLRYRDIAYVSCDPQDHPDTTVSDVVLQLANQYVRGVAIILYSRMAKVCYTTVMNLPLTNGIFTTVDPLVASIVLSTLNSSAVLDVAAASIDPDTNSFTNSRSDTGGPTTAVAMIILYSITAIITGLFVVIILTGAIRAHRHPERYGPRSGSGGRGRQSRAKGIARAMLETLPIVKFGDNQNKTDKEAAGDIEMPTTTPKETATKDQPQVNATQVTPAAIVAPSSSSSASLKNSANADGSDEAGSLGCSICTEDFQKGEEVRVLPCNHKFHPECVDPWLLNVSGTCPLCRIDLRTGREADDEELRPDEEASPTSPANSSTNGILRAALSGSREDRIAALRRFRHERRNRNSTAPGTNSEEERRTRASRLRERFRIRTRQHGAENAINEEDQRGQQSEGDTSRRSRSVGTFLQPR